MTRLASGAILLALVTAVTHFLPPVAFLAMIVALALLATREFCQLARMRGFAPHTWAAALAAALVVMTFFTEMPTLPAVLGLLAISIPVLSLAERSAIEDEFGNIVMTLFAAVFLGVLLGHMVALRLLPGADGHDLPFLLLVIIVAADTGAYYGGRFFGRRALAPRISPRKTVEGLLFGVGSGVAAALVARAWFMHRLPIGHAIALGIGLALVGCVGDLVESSLKRWAGAKDSSSLIPGHGGVLDRIDAVLFAAPVLFHYHARFLVERP